MTAPTINAWTTLSSQLDTTAPSRSAQFLCNYWGGFVQLDQAYVSTSDGF